MQLTAGAAATLLGSVARGEISGWTPAIAVGLAWAVGDEAASVRTLIAAALVVGAVLLARERPERMPT